MKKTVLLFIILCTICPHMILADTNIGKNDTVEVSKYYKTISIDNQVCTINNEIYNNSYTIEISKEEYELYNQQSVINSTTVHTTYKKMTTSISKNGSYYRYKVVLEWKNIPKVRSYDIIGIGFPASVKAVTIPVFKNYYCIVNDDCYTSTGYNYSYVGKNGVGVTFHIPTGNLSLLKQELYFDVGKNTTSTIIKQAAYGDYSHATKSVSLANAKKYIVDSGGIEIDEDQINNYDSINVARADWSGTW